MTIDIPYRVTDTLPPIFNSKLCQLTKPIWLSKSVPNLTQLVWVSMSEEETLCEQAEQALGVLYDEEVANFYMEAKMNAAAARASVS